MLKISLTYKHLSIIHWPHRQVLGKSDSLSYFQPPLYCTVIIQELCAYRHLVNKGLHNNDSPLGLFL